MCKDTLRQLRECNSALDERPPTEDQLELLLNNCEVIRFLFTKTLSVLGTLVAGSPELEEQVDSMKERIESLPHPKLGSSHGTR